MWRDIDLLRSWGSQEGPKVARTTDHSLWPEQPRSCDMIICLVGQDMGKLGDTVFYASSTRVCPGLQALRRFWAEYSHRFPKIVWEMTSFIIIMEVFNA